MISQIPVAILHLNVNPKHIVINLIIPQVTIQLTPYSAAIIKMTTNAVAPPVAILLFRLLINIFSFSNSYFFIHPYYWMLDGIFKHIDLNFRIPTVHTRKESELWRVVLECLKHSIKHPIFIKELFTIHQPCRCLQPSTTMLNCIPRI